MTYPTRTRVRVSKISSTENTMIVENKQGHQFEIKLEEYVRGCVYDYDMYKGRHLGYKGRDAQVEEVEEVVVEEVVDAKALAATILDEAIEEGFDFEGSTGVATKLIEGIIAERINNNTLDSISATDEMLERGLCSTMKEINILRRAIKKAM